MTIPSGGIIMTNTTTLQPFEIKGQAIAKRAFEVASVGNLSIMLIGAIGSSKSTTRAAFPAVLSAEREPCFCGHYGDVTRECVCTEQQIIRWYRRFERTAQEFDIILEMCQLSVKELMNNRKSDIQEQGWMTTRIEQARAFGAMHTSMDLSEDYAKRIMEIASRRLAFTPNQYNRVLKVARAIANLDDSEGLKGKHVAEAVQYRADATLYRTDKIVADRRAMVTV